MKLQNREHNYFWLLDGLRHSFRIKWGQKAFESEIKQPDSKFDWFYSWTLSRPYFLKVKLTSE